MYVNPDTSRLFNVLSHLLSAVHTLTVRVACFCRIYTTVY